MISLMAMPAGETRRVYPVENRTPLFLTASIAGMSSAAVRAQGFSANTWTPASAACVMNRAVVSLGWVIRTASGRSLRSTSSKSSYTPSP